jgi:hypothetical protein
MADPIFKNNGAWGSGVNRLLTDTECDGNNWAWLARMRAQEALAIGVGIASITQPTSNSILVTMTNANTYTFTLPQVALNFRGAWAANTPYALNDVFYVSSLSSVYVVIWAHTSNATFDPGANDGAMHNYYQTILVVPSDVPAAGATDQVLAKSSSADFALRWQSSGMPRAGTTGQALTKNSGTDFDASWDDIVFSELSGLPTIAQTRNSVVTTLGASGTVVLDPAVSDVFSITPTGAVTLNANSTPVANLDLIVTTSGTSSYVITFGTGFKTTGVLATGTTSGATFIVSFRGNGTNLIEKSRTAAM